MAQGTLTAGEVATVTLSKRVYDVVVAAAGGDIWVTSDGSTPGFGHPGSHRVVSGDSETIPVDAAADPTVIKLFSKAAAEYTITEGRAPEAAQSGATDWAAVEAPAVNITATGTGMVANILAAESSDLVGGTTVKADGAVGAVVNVLVNGSTAFGAASEGGDTKISFYNADPVAQQTGVAVTAEAIHAALVALGLITA